MSNIYRKDDSIKVELSVMASWALGVCGWVFMREGYTCTVTSAHDGKHSNNSKHYAARGERGGVRPQLADAFDLRTRQIPGDVLSAMATELAGSLGDDFDVVIEPTHLHVEYDPV